MSQMSPEPGFTPKNHKPHKCKICFGSALVPHCASPNCSWVYCHVCGVVTGFVYQVGRTVLGSFHSPRSA